MNRWQTIELGQIAASVDYGVTASASQQPIGPKFLRITDIQNGSVDWEQVPWCRCDLRSATESRLLPGDIVFARTGATTGKSFLIRECPPNTVFASYLIRVRLGSGTDSKYVYQFFQTPDYWAQITKSARGVAQPGVNASTLKVLKVPLPAIAEQRRIAAILDKANELRAKRRTALAELDILTQAIFLNLFGDPATNPKKWSVLAVGDFVLDVTNGLTRRRKESDTGTDIVLRLRDIRSGWIDFSDVNRITLTQQESSRYQVRAGDLLFIRVNGNPDYVGRCAVFEGYSEPIYFNDHIMCVKLDQSKILGAFLSFVLNGPHGKKQIALYRKTSAGQHTISQGGLSKIHIPIPPIDLQREFVRRIAAVDNLKAAHRASLAHLDALFASLQHRAFRGEL